MAVFVRSASRPERGQVVVLLVIVLAVLGGGAWWLFVAKRQSEEGARAFAREAATRLALHFDQKFLDVRLGREAQVSYPPSFRERLLNRLRQLGVPAQEIELEGEVTFTSHFFEPKGQFRARLNYPTKPAYLDLTVSNRQTWQIDRLNLTWDPTPVATPEPALAISPTPVATP